MARKPMVTRTLKSTAVTCMALNIVTAEPETITVLISGNVTDKKKALKEVQKIAETDEFKVVSVVALSIQEKMYGMLESDFIANAKELDPETRKQYEEQE